MGTCSKCSSPVKRRYRADHWWFECDECGEYGESYYDDEET